MGPSNRSRILNAPPGGARDRSKVERIPGSTGALVHRDGRGGDPLERSARAIDLLEQLTSHANGHAPVARHLHADRSQTIGGHGECLIDRHAVTELANLRRFPARRVHRAGVAAEQAIELAPNSAQTPAIATRFQRCFAPATAARCPRPSLDQRRHRRSVARGDEAEAQPGQRLEPGRRAAGGKEHVVAEAAHGDGNDDVEQRLIDERKPAATPRHDQDAYPETKVGGAPGQTELGSLMEPQVVRVHAAASVAIDLRVVVGFVYRLEVAQPDAQHAMIADHPQGPSPDVHPVRRCGHVDHHARRRGRDGSMPTRAAASR